MPYTTGGSIRWISGVRPKLPSITWDAGNHHVRETLAAAIRDVRSVVLMGPVGVGKTVLMAECEFWLALRFGYGSSAWVDAETYADDVRAGWKYASQFKDWSARFSADGIAGRIPMLFLDDLGVERENNVELVVSLLRDRHLRTLPMWVTTNLNLKDLKQRYGERTFSRLCQGAALVELHGDDRRLQVVA